MTVRELAKEIAARENDTDVESVTDKQRKSVYVSLYQTHLPKLADAGIIWYNDGTAGLTERATEINPYFTMTSGTEYPWHKHYLLLAAISGLVLLARLVKAPGFNNIPANIISVVVTLTFGTSGIVQFVMSQREEEETLMELCKDSC